MQDDGQARWRILEHHPSPQEDVGLWTLVEEAHVSLFCSSDAMPFLLFAALQSLRVDLTFDCHHYL